MHCSKGPAGDFRIKKETAERMGLTVSKSNDQRFDVDDSSWAAAKYLKTLDSYFSEETVLIGTLKTIPISDSVERRKFAIAAYNAGEGNIAKAQRAAKKAENSPVYWDSVKEFLDAAGISSSKADEMRDYVKKVSDYEIEFAEKSSTDQRIKLKQPTKLDKQELKVHWVTIDANPVLIKD